MAVRSEREKSKMQERYQLILAQMLKEEDNKYCVDCDTKSPRWASWNIGVFICIRCAGFHRNLGVHISKVKSVNLDSWTGEQIASVQAMGNSRARAVYEANLPDGFRRPQTDSPLESFIRAKYEQRKWIAKEWIPPEITVPIDLIESETNHKRMETTSDTRRIENNISKLKPFTVPLVRQTVLENNTQNLLNLDEPSANNTSSSSNILGPLHDLFTTVSQSKTEEKTETSSMEEDIKSVFSSTNETATNHSGMMSNENIMALFNTSQTSTVTISGMNIRPAPVQPPNLSSPGFAYPPPQHSHLLPHQKSLSFGNNLSQHATNLTSQSQVHILLGINHHHPNGMSAPVLQSPSSSFTQEQLNTQFSQFMPFTNTKNNPSTTVLRSDIPMHSITGQISVPSHTPWQS